MTAEVYCPGNKSIKLNKPGLTAKLQDADGRKLLIHTNPRKEGFVALYDQYAINYIIGEEPERSQLLESKGILFERGNVLQLNSGSFIQAK